MCAVTSPSPVFVRRRSPVPRSLLICSQSLQTNISTVSRKEEREKSKLSGNPHSWSVVGTNQLTFTHARHHCVILTILHRLESFRKFSLGNLLAAGNHSDLDYSTPSWSASFNCAFIAAPFVVENACPNKCWLGRGPPRRKF
jgi:hypothetical protein